MNNNPFEQFELWFKEAQQAEIIEANAMSIATASSEGEITIRTVFLKYFDTNGFVFFTNYESKKAQQIAENPNVALLFPWLKLERQVKIMGTAEKISAAESFKYFASRPRGSQIGAWCSKQSSVISSRSVLLNKFEEIKQKYKDGQIPLPSFWGGFRVVPKKIEFWQGKTNRLHDRFLYTHANNSWEIEHLSP
ncbi:pyridoxamine 5'-phosphate oxidase [Candidatus Marithrix sp. Canyon 246]|nr:pyridoxamine 5'-phosphate oxidase [Candidatus Marithrix sp. Canyon 246]